MILQPVVPQTAYMLSQVTPPRGAFQAFVSPVPLDLTHSVPVISMEHRRANVSAIDVQAARALQDLCNATSLFVPTDVPTWASPRPAPHTTEPSVSRTHVSESPTPSPKLSASPADGNSTPRDRFMAEVTRLAAANGTPLVRVPEMGSRALDLYELYQRVTARGGLNVVVTNKLWKPVAKELGIPLGSCTDYGYRLRRHYVRYLLPYEQLYHSTEDCSRKKRKRQRSESARIIGSGPRQHVGVIDWAKTARTTGYVESRHPFATHGMYRALRD